jgi:hypothetical protein
MMQALVIQSFATRDFDEFRAGVSPASEGAQLTVFLVRS